MQELQETVMNATAAPALPLAPTTAHIILTHTTLTDAFLITDTGRMAGANSTDFQHTVTNTTDYARNVGKAMKAVKASTKGGRKGKLSNPRTTFKTVSKTVSKIMKGGTRPRGGITGIISKAVKGSFKRKPKKTRSSRPGRRY